MKPLTITAKIGKNGPAHTAKLNFAENLEELAEQYGEETVFRQAKAQIIVALQSFMRSKATSKEPVTGDALQKEVEKWEPGNRAPAGDRVEKLKDRLAKLSDAERDELHKQLLAMASGAGAESQNAEGNGSGAAAAKEPQEQKVQPAQAAGQSTATATTRRGASR
jgi:hypothetical protein